MDGPQDLGGKESFGPIEVDAPAYRHAWEERQWALTKLNAAPGVTIDWFRHGIETMPPSVYLSVPYFQKWNVNNLALAVDAGQFTLEECIKGHADRSAPAAQVLTKDDCEALQRGMNADFSRPAETTPKFTIGDPVVTEARPRPGHSRLPAYARGAKGRITAHHGAHLFADAGAKGDHIAEHLYTVEFRAGDLWEDAETPDDAICLDLWEPYLASP